ncbi:CDP-glycerol glycerophosphotransferase family protein [Streptomyces albus]
MSAAPTGGPTSGRPPRTTAGTGRPASPRRPDPAAIWRCWRAATTRCSPPARRSAAPAAWAGAACGRPGGGCPRAATGSTTRCNGGCRSSRTWPSTPRTGTARPACNPQAVEAAARRLAPHVRSVWIVRPEAVAALPPGTDHVLPGTRRYWKVLARGTYFVNNVNFPDHLVKRRGQVHVMTHHGTPLKTMGLDQRPYPAARMDFDALLRRASRWDYSVTSNPHSAEVWHRAFPCGYRDLPAGYPRNDRYATAGPEQIAGIRERLGIPEGGTVLLYAPTARDYREGYLPDLDLEAFSSRLGDQYVVLVRTHYFYGRHEWLRELHERGLVRDVSRHPSTEDLCLAADALITDYSSLMFDYACLDRPLVVHAPDWDSYRDARGTYFDLLSGRPGETPGPVTRTVDELVAVFCDGTWRDDRSRALRAAFRERFCPWDDGHAAERTRRTGRLPR